MQKEKNRKMKQFLGEVLNQISGFMEDDLIFRKHLNFFCLFSDYEWYNIAAILYQKPTAILVRSKDSWDQNLVDGEFFPKKGERAIRVYAPHFSSEAGNIDWESIAVFDIQQCSRKLKIEYYSVLKEVIDKLGDIGFDYLEKYYKNISWQRGFIQEIIRNNFPEVYKTLWLEEIQYIENAVLVSVGEKLYMKDDEYENLNIDYVSKDSKRDVQIYKTIKEIVGVIPTYLLDMVYDAYKKELELTKLQEALKMQKMNIQSRIKQAKAVINKRLPETLEATDDMEEDDSGLPKNANPNKYPVFIQDVGVG